MYCCLFFFTFANLPHQKQQTFCAESSHIHHLLTCIWDPAPSTTSWWVPAVLVALVPRGWRRVAPQYCCWKQVEKHIAAGKSRCPRRFSVRDSRREVCRIMMGICSWIWCKTWWNVRLMELWKNLNIDGKSLLVFKSFRNVIQTVADWNCILQLKFQALNQWITDQQ